MSTAATRNGIVLGIAACIAIVVIAAVFYLTRNRILDAENKQLKNHLTQLLDANSFDNDPSTDTLLISDEALGTAEPMRVYRARSNNKPVAAVVTAMTPAAYNGPITYLIGLKHNGDIIAVRVTKHNETPGLGDDLEIRRSDWIRSFEQLAVNEMTQSHWQVKKDGGQFDQFTGATITPRTLVRSVHQVSQWYVENRDLIFSDAIGTHQ